MRVIVCGGRDYKDGETLYRVLNEMHRQHPFVELFEGGARGADRLAAMWAATFAVKSTRIPANWTRYGLKAGPIRNKHMLWTADPHLVIAFPGGAGTEDMVQFALKEGHKVIRVKEDGTYDTEPFI